MSAGGSLTAVALGILLGGGLGLGACLILWSFPRWHAVSLDRRLLPYIRDIADPQGLTPLVAPVEGVGMGVFARSVMSRIGGAAALSDRLSHAGRPSSAGDFRVRQLWWAAGGLLCGGLLGVVSALVGGSQASLLLPTAGAVTGIVLPEAALRHAIRQREQRIGEELPTVLEFLSLCLAAGESTFDALRRVAAVGEGELIGLLRRAVVSVETGAGLADALREVSRVGRVSGLTRAIDQIIAAIERGAPVAQVLQAQAADAQDEAKRELMERAGRKEIAMLFPLVFLILPLSVIIAVFPGVLMLRLGP